MTTLLKPLEITLAGGLRGSATFSLRVGESSTLTQEIILDAMCPYICFKTQVRLVAAVFPGELNPSSEFYSPSSALGVPTACCPLQKVKVVPE